MYPILFKINIFNIIVIPINTYGFLFALGCIAGLLWANRLCKKEQISFEKFSDSVFYSLLAGILGARIFYIFTDINFFIENPLEIFKIWKGGLVFYGGLLFAALFFILYLKKQDKENFFRYLDIAAVVMPLGHFFGRLGCLSFGCCFGKISKFGISFPKGSPAYYHQIFSGLINSQANCSLKVIPTQLISASYNLLLFFILNYMFKKDKFKGKLILYYFNFYSILRFSVEFLRDDYRGRFIFYLSPAQVISLVIFFFSLYYILKNHYEKN